MVTHKILCNSKHAVMLFCLTLLVVFFSGCTSMVHDMQVTGDYANFNETLQSSLPISPGMSRVVIYYPRLALGGVSLLGVGGGAFIHFELESSEYFFKHTIWDQAAVYLDVVPGTYVFRESVTKKEVAVLAEEGKTHYIRICANSGLLNYDASVVVEEVLALAEIKKGNVRGNLNNPLLGMVPKVSNAMTEASFLPTVSDQNNYGKLYVFLVTGRPGPIQIKLGLDTQSYYNLKKKKYCCITVPVGPHVLTSAIKPPLISKDVYQIGHFVEVKQNEDTYVMYYSKGYVQEYQLKYLTQEEGLNYLKKHKLNQNGYLLMQ